MLRWLVLATLALALPRADAAQALSVLHIKVVLTDNGRTTPVPRHTLLVSDNPSSRLPRVVVTGLDGAADVKLPQGNYTVESDRPVVLHGKAYQWTQVVDIVSGQDAVLELSAGNAEVAPAVPAATRSGTAAETDPAFLLPRWQDSVVALWTPYTRASGFVVDARGLIVTNQRAIDTTSSAEVQLTPAIKVEARVLVSDPARDIAVLWINPNAIASITPVPLPCGQAAAETIVDGQDVFTIGVARQQEKEMASGKLRRVGPGAADSSFMLGADVTGGPVFSAGGTLVGITSVVNDDQDRSREEDIRVVRAGNACASVADAEKKLSGAAPPGDARLPLEPAQVFPIDSLKTIVEGRAGSLNPYQISSSDFDVAFITPVTTYGAQYQAEQARKRERNTRPTSTDLGQVLVQRQLDFGDWSPYFDSFPPVLVVRVTPKMAESFWKMLGRGAARTQGVAIPPLKSFKSSFSRLRAFCGDAEVPPIHPFKLRFPVSETNVITEGLYVFDPGALGPTCGKVTLVLYSEKQPDKGDTRVVDPAVIQQIWQDFAPYRASAKRSG